MPFARFERLALEKRERLFDVAAQEFASRGFEHASLNHILEQAQMGKGSAYYYFEDKADLFGALIEYTRKYLQLDDLRVDDAALTPETFWSTVAALRRKPLLRSFEHPWFFWVLSVPAQLSPAPSEREPLARLSQQIRTLLMQLIQRGQRLGVIRADVPDDLLLAWLLALDQASDRWLMSHWEALDRDTVARVSDQTVAAIARAFALDVSSSDSGQPSSPPVD